MFLVLFLLKTDECEAKSNLQATPNRPSYACTFKYQHYCNIIVLKPMNLIKLDQNEVKVFNLFRPEGE